MSRYLVYGDGSQQRDYLYVGDLVFGIEQALRTTETGAFQLGSGKPTTLKALIEALFNVAASARKSNTSRPAAARSTPPGATSQRRGENFGFDPATTLEDGLAATWQWYIANQDVWTDDVALTSSD